METLADKIVLLAISFIAFFIVPVDAMNVGLLLGSFSLATVLGLLTERAASMILIAALIAACLYPAAAIFLAPIAYCCMRLHGIWKQLAWTIVPLCTFWRLGFDAWTLGIALELVACALAMRTNALLSERRQYRVLRDSLREQSLSLEERNRALARKMGTLETGNNHDGSASPDPSCNAARADARPALVLANLTERELEIAAYVSRGLDNKEIAAEVFASEGTVRNHISAILQKSGLRNRTQLAVAYLNACDLR